MDILCIVLQVYFHSENEISESKILWLSPSDLIDRPYNDASRKIWDYFHVKYVLFKNGLILKIAVSCVQNVGLIRPKFGFLLLYKCYCSLTVREPNS